MKALEGAIEECLFSDPIEMTDVFSQDMSSVCSNQDRLHVFKVMSPLTGTGERVLMLKAYSVVSSNDSLSRDVSWVKICSQM